MIIEQLKNDSDIDVVNAVRESIKKIADLDLNKEANQQEINKLDQQLLK